MDTGELGKLDNEGPWAKQGHLVTEWLWVLYVTVGTILGWSLIYWIYPDLEVSFVLLPMPIVVVYLVRLIGWKLKKPGE